MNNLLKTLKFLRILDSEDNLSLTNLLLIGSFVWLTISQTPLVTILFITALIRYAHKRHVEAKEFKDMKVFLNDATLTVDTLQNDLKDTVDSYDEEINNKLQQLEQYNNRLVELEKAVGFRNII